MSRQVVVSAVLRALPGRGDDLARQLATALARSRDEPGTITYLAHRAQQDPDLIMFYEVFADADAYEHHRATAAVTVAELGPLLASPPEITLFELIGGHSRLDGLILEAP